MKRYIVFLLAAGVLFAGLTGCSQLAGGGQLDKPAENREVKVGTWKTAQTLTPYFYETYFDGELEVLPFTNPGDQKTALLAGSLAMTGTTIPTAILAAANGEPVKIVASLCNKCSALAVSKASGVKTEADLRGKTIAYVPGTMHHVLLLDVLHRAGLDPEKDVTLTRIDFFDMGQAMQNGQIDAFLSGEPYPSQAVLEGYGQILSYPYFDDTIGPINAAMIVTDETVKKNPALVQALVSAHVKAARYLSEHQDKWQEMAASFGTQREILALSAENIELCWDIDKDYIEHTKNLARQMLELGMIDKMPDIDALFDLSFLEQAKKDIT